MDLVNVLKNTPEVFYWPETDTRGLRLTAASDPHRTFSGEHCGSPGRRVDSLFDATNNGTGERGLLLAEEKGFSHLMNLQGVFDWWKENPYAFSPEFRRYMEGFRTTAA